MITVTITIQKQTMDEVLDALTEIETRSSDELTSLCEEARESLASTEAKEVSVSNVS